MIRLLPLLLLTGCFDFTGEQETIGFSTNLMVDALQRWNPEAAVASGTRVVVVAEEPAEGDDDLPALEGSVTGDLAADPEERNTLAVTGPRRGEGTVRFDGPLTDHFALRFEPARHARLVDLGPLLGAPPADLALSPGGASIFVLRLEDRARTPLGYDPAALGLKGRRLDARLDAENPGLVFLQATDTGRAVLRVDYLGRRLDRIALPVVSPDEVERLELVVAPEQESAVQVMALAWLDDDTRLAGAPVEWSWTGDLRRDDDDLAMSDMLVLDREGAAGPIRVEARLGALSATVEVP